MLDLKDFARRKELGRDVEDEFEIDIDRLQQEIEGSFNGGKDELLFEGHFAHLLETDLCVVLRCEPEELKERLRKRDYSDSKVEENVRAEAMDLILQRAVERHDKIIEIETTGRSSEEVADEILDRIEREDYGYGSVDYSDYF